jgi:hypothetical protein
VGENRQVRATANSIKEARAKIHEQVPEGMAVLLEKILSHGRPQAVEAMAENVDAAFQEAASTTPASTCGSPLA